MKEPLVDYPWKDTLEKVLNSEVLQDKDLLPFLFDVVMSLAYIDSTNNLSTNLEFCSSGHSDYNAHLGFINLCAKCYAHKIWRYQKAAKPSSGALGKLSSELILKFISSKFEDFDKVQVVGGTNYADAIIHCKSGELIYAEVKSAPLITFPLLVKVPFSDIEEHEKLEITHSQLQECDSALYINDHIDIPLGKVHSHLWPFQGLLDFIEKVDNKKLIYAGFDHWNKARDLYKSKDKTDPIYYLVNASGAPPQIAKTDFGWPKKEVISDSKTSAGLDRTDDIKKGIYQTLKIGSNHRHEPHVKTAIISNLPAYRHEKGYIKDLIPLVWGDEANIVNDPEIGEYISKDNLRYVFDYIITLDYSTLRDLETESASKPSS
ncbi:hypothetical protein FSC05_15255 (plasmid) [Acinetobacter indicus]|uniref:hypothetical protein n=1 Tax=Acinetobacter TaxID=469 RepID=UPI0013B0974C|nr:hypothetical protein [Acinetobacter indicus]QIC75016.1 hypothetical protein FSC05_15255 [Acinetobacter indicus]